MQHVNTHDAGAAVTAASRPASPAPQQLPATPPPPTELTYRQRVIHGAYTADWESAKAELITAGSYRPPTFSEMNSDVKELDGKTIFVEGMGEAEVISHTRRMCTPNGSIVRFPNDLVVELKLERKANGGVRWLARRDEASGADAAAALQAEVAALHNEYNRMCRSSYRRLSFPCDGAVPTDLIEAREFLTKKIHMMRLIKKRQGQIVPIAVGVSYGTQVGTAAAASGAGISGALVPLLVPLGVVVALEVLDGAGAMCAIKDAKSNAKSRAVAGQVVYASEALDAPLVDKTAQAA